jgi:hypothetical protein
VRASCLESTWYSCSFLHPAIPCPFSCSHCLRSMSNPNPSIQGTKMVCATPVGSLKFDVGLGRGISEVALQGPSQLSAMTSIAQPQHDDTLPVTLFRKRRSRGSVAHCSRVLLLDRNKDRFSRTVWTRASSSTKSRDPKAGRCCTHHTDPRRIRCLARSGLPFIAFCVSLLDPRRQQPSISAVCSGDIRLTGPNSFSYCRQFLLGFRPPGNQVQSFRAADIQLLVLCYPA